MKKFIQDFKVLQNKNLDQYFILELQAPKPLPEIIPGQFVEALIKNSPSTFLRRPFSIFDVNVKENTLSLFIKKVGEGTSELSQIAVGESLNLVYPLGNGFSMPTEKDILFIGGGYGIAPFLYFSKCLSEKGIQPSILIGARTKKDIQLENELKKYGQLFISTDDGSLGEKGLVTQHSILKNIFSKIFSCGPEPMMKAVAKLAKEKNIECEVSLENTMACGVGICLCCVTETIHGNKCVCSEGPVFNIKELKW